MPLLWLLYLSAAGGLLLALRWIGRPIPARRGVVFVALPILFCAPGFFRGRTLLPIDHIRLFPPWSTTAGGQPRNADLNDVATQIAPWAKAVRMAWKEGSFPWRNRWNGCGMALAANSQSAAFSPFTLVTLPLPLASAPTLAVALKLLLALVGFWLWLREMELSSAAALLGAVSYSFSLTIMPWLLFSLSSVFCLWPWALFAVELLRHERSPRGAWLLLVAILCAFVLGGHPESAVLGGIFAVLYLVSRLILRDRSLHRRVLRRFLGSGLLAAGLTAALWIPQLIAIRASNRYHHAEEFRQRLPVSIAPHGLVWRYGLLTSIVPRVLGDDFDSPRIAEAMGSFPEMALGYFGLVGWVFVLQVFRPGNRDKRELGLLILLVCGLAVGVGMWPLFDLFLSLPLLRVVFWLRFLSFAALAGSAVAAFEFDRWIRDRGRLRFEALLNLAPILFLGGLVVWAWAHFGPRYPMAGSFSAQRCDFRVAIAVLGVCGLTLALPTARLRISAVAPYFLVAVATAELFYQGVRLYRWGSPADVFPQTPLVRFLQSQEGPFRTVSDGAALYPSTNVFAGVEDIRTHDAVERRDYVEFLDRTCGYDPIPYFKHIRDINASVLDFLNVRFLVTEAGALRENERWRLVYSGADGRVFENRRVLPRVFAPERVRFEGDSPERESFPPENWEASATVRGQPDVAAGRVVVAQNLPTRISDYRESTNSIRFQASSSGAMERSVLVTSLVQDGGWSAHGADGQPLTTVRANGIFVGLVLEAGRGEIALDYSPPGLRRGMVISLCAFAVLALCVGTSWRRRAPGRKI